MHESFYILIFCSSFLLTYLLSYLFLGLSLVIFIAISWMFYVNIDSFNPMIILLFVSILIFFRIKKNKKDLEI
ncbi:MAG: hypothetical protein COA66_04775 [Arcobacter sp.]|nr:MAG: hypothetical protein COA66_04775 [Arcobacter sp.]